MEQLTAEIARKLTKKVIDDAYGDYANYRNEALKIQKLREKLDDRISNSIDKGIYATYLTNIGEEVCAGKEILMLLKAEYKDRGFNFTFEIGHYRSGFFFCKKHPTETIFINW